MFCKVWNYLNSKQKDIQYKMTNLPRINKTEIKILTNPGLARALNNLPKCANRYM